MGVVREMVKVAFENRVQDNLETTYAVDWPGASFDTTVQDEWLRVGHLGMSPQMINGNGGNEEDDWTFQVDCFARMGEQTDQTSTNRVWEMADDVFDTFRFVDVDVLDRDQVGNPSIGTLQFLIPQVDVISLGGPEGPGDHLAVTLNARYTEIGP